MVLINELENFAEVKLAAKGSLKSPFTWRIRSELRNRLINTFLLELSHYQQMHQLFSHCSSADLKEALARVCLEEQTHQTMINSVFKKLRMWEHYAETELAFINSLSWLAQVEPDAEVKEIYNHLLLDHATHLQELVNIKELEFNSDFKAEVSQLPAGRPLADQFKSTTWYLKTSYSPEADPATKANLRTVIGAENVISSYNCWLINSEQQALRELASLKGVVEAGHLLMLEAKLNPDESMIEKAFYAELAEVMNLNRLLAAEKEATAQEIYSFLIEEDELHLKMLGSMLADMENIDPSQISQSKAFTAKPRRTTEHYLEQLAA